MDLLVKKGALAETRLADAPAPPLADGEARLRVDLFSLTANNVTYGAMGDFLKYWNFFPTSEAGWGRVPVWGFATVVESKSPTVKAGERVYGYLPMSDTFVIRPGERKNGGFAEASEHRAGLAPVYNRYEFNTDDLLYTPQTEAIQTIFRPLFFTAFLIDDFIADAGWFGAKQVVFSSASAKTAYVTALLMKKRGEAKIVGLTSPGNVAFTRGLDAYDEVIAYDAVGKMDGSVPAVFVDIAGNSAVRAAAHLHFGANLKYSCAVGATHWDAPRTTEALPGAQPQMFFAPDVVKKRMAEWGGIGFQQRAGGAWARFLPFATRTTRLVEHRGLEAAGKVFADLATGRAAPQDGHVVKLG